VPPRSRWQVQMVCDSPLKLSFRRRSTLSFLTPLPRLRNLPI